MTVPTLAPVLPPSNGTKQFLVVIAVQAVVSLATLGCSTALAILGRLPSDATVALFTAAIALAGGTASIATVKQRSGPEVLLPPQS